MAEETLKTAAAEAETTTAATEEVVVAEKAGESEPAPVAEEEKAEVDPAEQIAESVSFKEETNVVSELPDPQKVALDELKQLVQDALNKHELSAPPPEKPVEEEKKTEEEVLVAPTKEEETTPPVVVSEEVAATPADVATPAPAPPAKARAVINSLLGSLGLRSSSAEKKTEEAAAVAAPAADVAEEKPKEAEEISLPPPQVPVEVEESKIEETAPPAKEEEKAEPSVIEGKTIDETTPVTVVEKTVEAIEESIVSVVPETAAPAEEEAPAPAPAPPVSPEEVSIWGIPLLADERSDVVLLKFLRARDFKVKEAFAMLRNTVRWQKEFKIEDLIEEDLGTELEKVVYIQGLDKEGHPVCYNAYGEFQNKELYQSTFADEEKRGKFLRWRIQFLEKTIRKELDFSPDGMSTFVQVNDLRNSPGPFKRELRVATNQALQLLQDNYPEFVAKQVFINVPWWYLAFYRMISPFFTQRTKSKFVFAGPSKSAETLFKYIAPEQVPVQYGGLSKEGEQEFATSDLATEEIIKPTSKHTVEIPVSEGTTLVWESRVLGWDVSYGAEFVPSAEGGYTVILQKSRKITPSDETVISDSFKVTEAGKVVLTFDNVASSKKKKLLYRSKTKTAE